MSNRRQRLLRELRAACPLLDGQASDAAFEKRVLDAWTIYDRVYHRDDLQGTAKDDEKRRQRMMHTLVAVYLSAQQQCRGYVSGGAYAAGAYDPDNLPNPPDVTTLLHRHDAPRVAAKHLETCFFSFIPTGDRSAAQAALETLVVERLLRGKINFAGAHRMLSALRGAPYSLDDAGIRTVILLGTIVYHVCMAVTPPESKSPFDPGRAHGWLLPAHKQGLFGNTPGDPPQLSDDARTKIGTLFASCSIATAAPPVRWPDPSVSGSTVLSAPQKAYLQSLPTMDRTGARAAARTACEQEIRRRVRYRMHQLLQHAPNPLGGLQQVHAQHLATATGPGDLNALLDALIDDMRSGTYWIESTCTDTLLILYEKALAQGTHAQFKLMNETELRQSPVPWNRVLDRCPKAAPGSVTGTFAGMRYHPLDLAQRVDGRQNAKDWYLDWRHDKDEVIYDCHDFPLSELPNFASFMPWAGAPEPNETYGAHMIVWNPAILARSAMTVGDWGTPRRSLLLVLQDLLTDVKRKDGSSYSDSARVKKFHTFERLLRHLDAQLRPAPAPPAGPGARLRTLFQQALPVPTKKFTGDKVGMRTDDIENLECHVFGPMKISSDALCILVCRDRNYKADPSQPAKNQALINKLRQHKLNITTLAWDLEDYEWEDEAGPGKRVLKQRLGLYDQITYGRIKQVQAREPSETAPY